MTRRIIQVYRGTTAQNDSFTGEAGELTMDTTKNELRLHDGSTAGGHVIGSGYHPELFAVQWADHEINDMAWLRADTFSWQDGTVYSNAYDHLVDDISGKSLTSETIAGTTVQFYLADDGHKICPATQETNVATIFSSTGIAWYYILDTDNTRFKLPRTKFGLTGLRDTVGKYVDAGLPNITGSFDVASDKNIGSGAFSWTGNKTSTNGGGAGGQWQINFSAHSSNSIYGNSTTVQPQATQMYLYFYVGQFTQTALENTAGLNASLFNGKADTDLSNVSNNIDFVIDKQDPTSSNDYTWYRKYKSGWVEQGGCFNRTIGTSATTWQYTLPVPMANAQYTASVNTNGGNAATTYIQCEGNSTTVIKGYARCPDSSQQKRVMWLVCGYAAS